MCLGKCQISAPYAGRIAEQKIREQQYAQAGQPLLDIIDDSVLELEFLVPSRWLSWLHCLAILWSTIATRQHVVLDVAAGAVVGLIFGLLSLRHALRSAPQGVI